MVERKTSVERIGASVPPRLDSLMRVSTSDLVPEATCLGRVRLLAACYRKGEADDPEVYAAACAAVLSEYPLGVVMFVTDPRTGLPSTSQWLPTVKEIKDACEECVQAADSREKRERNLRQQFKDRERFDADQAAKSSNPTYEEIVTECAADGLAVGPRCVELTAPEHLKRKYGLSDREFAALPDLPSSAQKINGAAARAIENARRRM